MLLFEGEEAVPCPQMAAFLREQRDMLAADAVLVINEAVLDPRTPLIMYGVRGSVSVEVDVHRLPDQRLRFT